MLTCTPLVYPSGNPRRHGLTIVEMLVALACVVLLMLAYTQLFSDVGGRISDSRSMIELENRMRTATHRLRTDLAGLTCPTLPWQRPEDGLGYFEYIEGQYSDKNSGYTTDPLFLGDVDDILMFTVRSKEGPFTGQYQGQPVQSEVAEVVWFTRPTLQKDGVTVVTPPTYTLYRRVFLVMPTYQGNPTNVSAAASGRSATGELLPAPPGAAATFYDTNDVSVHLEVSPPGGSTVVAVANTLGDLTKRECRYGHGMQDGRQPQKYGFPYSIDASYIVPFGGEYNLSPAPNGTYITHPNNSRYGEDVVLTNVVGFDIQVWDPTAPVYLNNGIAVGPSDPGFASVSGTAPNANAPAGQGAFVDLNWLQKTWDGVSQIQWATSPSKIFLSPFSTGGHPKSQLQPTMATVTPPGAATYDTWSYHYEHDGINQNSSVTTDASTDGFQDDVNNTETSPPYPVPLRGIKVRIRCYEPDARQFHEVSVVESFVPE